MAKGTKIFPVASVRRIIQMIAVLMVDRQELSLGRGKFPAASGADQPVKGQGPIPITFLGREIGPDFLDNLFNRLITSLGWFDLPARTPAWSKRHPAHGQFSSLDF